jgi:hypothetical protein
MSIKLEDINQKSLSQDYKGKQLQVQKLKPTTGNIKH